MTDTERERINAICKVAHVKVTFTDYVPGEKQQTIVTWEDEKE